MGLEDINIDFDIGEMIEGANNAVFKTFKIIFTMFVDLPPFVKITMAILFVLFTIGIGFLTWKYRDEWMHVKY